METYISICSIFRALQGAVIEVFMIFLKIRLTSLITLTTVQNILYCTMV